jgi:hypothetical protein
MSAAARKASPGARKAIEHVHAVTQRHLAHLRSEPFSDAERVAELRRWWLKERDRCLLRLKRRTTWTHPKTGEVKPIGRRRPSLVALVHALYRSAATRSAMTGHREFIVPISRPSISACATEESGYGVSPTTFTACMPALVGADVGILYVHGRDHHNGLVAFPDSFDDHRHGEGAEAMERYRAAEARWWRPMIDALEESVPSDRVVQLEAEMARRDAKLARYRAARNAHFKTKQEERLHEQQQQAKRDARDVTGRLHALGEAAGDVAGFIPTEAEIVALTSRPDAVVANPSRAEFPERKGSTPPAVCNSSLEDRAPDGAASGEADALRAEAKPAAPAAPASPALRAEAPHAAVIASKAAGLVRHAAITLRAGRSRGEPRAPLHAAPDGGSSEGASPVVIDARERARDEALAAMLARLATRDDHATPPPTPAQPLRLITTETTR